jgi:hypothetical protein
MVMSEPDTATAFDALLLPPAPVPPLMSLAAPVATDTLDVCVVVGVPLTGHEMLAPGATEAGAVGVQTPTVTPAGRPEIEQVALVAVADAVALLVHKMVPE